MLGVELQPRSDSRCGHPPFHRNMPVDYTSYLLSASPPGFDFYHVRGNFLADAKLLRQPANHKNSLPGPKVVKCNSDTRSVASCLEQLRLDSNDCRGSAEDISAIAETRAFPSHTQSEADLTSRFCGGKKRVSFADDLGFRLVTVKFMTEASDSPPRLRPELLSSLTKDDNACVTQVPPLELGFQQPASDYIQFREKLDKNCVSLENVILRDYNIMGTVKVKNLHFEKSVTVRISFDGWQSSKDIEAKYVNNGNSGPNDTFSFEIEVPTNIDSKSQMEFCVRYAACGHPEYWDSNDGQNYKVFAAAQNGCSDTKQTSIFSLPSDTEWSEFSSWSHLDTSGPYY